MIRTYGYIKLLAFLPYAKLISVDIYLIDGNAFVYRAFFAIKGLSDSKGRPTGAIYGFTNTLLKILRERRPGGIVVSFDSPQPTERHVLFEKYKAHRPEMPDDLRVQFPQVRRMIDAFRIRILQMPGYEADDIIATVAEKAAKAGMDVFIVTSDKDMLQLIDERVKVYDPINDRMLDGSYVREKLGVPPEHVTDYMALVGDAVDNIPGIKGIGDKTAKELLGEFASLDELLAHTGRIKKERIRKLIEDNADLARLSKKLAEINRNVPVDFDLRDFSVREPDWQSLLSLFRDFEFFSFMRLIPGGPPPERKYEAVTGIPLLRDRIGAVRGEFSINAEATGKDPMRDTLVGFSICPEKGTAFYVPLAHTSGEQMDKAESLAVLKPLAEDGSRPKIGHDMKFDIVIFGNEGVDIGGTLYDTMVAAYLINPLRSDYSLENVSLDYLARKKKTFNEVVGKGGTAPREIGGMASVSIRAAADFSCDNAELAFELRGLLFGRLPEMGLERLYFDIEMPLIYVLAEMERTGVKIDTSKLNSLSGELEGEIKALERRIYFLAGGEFNIGSPKQLSKLLFENLGLKPGRRKKTGYSTDVSVLEELAKTHELPREVLNWRTLTKLKSTYVDVLPALINPSTGRLHSSFNQAATATGRLSSSEPNLQNIPVRGQWGRRIREAFVAEEGNVLIAADYSQIELRVMAHMSGDVALKEAFHRNIDVHTRTASELFGVPEDKVTSDMRRAAKTVNFGVIYGITPFGLSEALGISKEEAAKYISRYFQRHAGIKAYTEGVLAEAREKGYVRTLYGRIRPVPELNSKSPATRQLGERLAVNSPIQGTAADIIKIAMINVSKRLKEHNASIFGGKGVFDPSDGKGSVTLQVHDELVFEAPEGEAGAVMAIVKEEMEGAAALSVPLRVDMGYGKNWGALRAFEEEQ